MLLDFSISKAIAATAYLLEGKGGADDMFPLIKKIYFADRTALINWGNSITGDSLASMKRGPIVSTIYDLLKGKGEDSDLTQWNDFIERQQPYKISLRKKPDEGVLSEREKEVLEQSRKTIDSIRGSIPDWFHSHCPEWTDPGESSVPIDPSVILRLANKSEEEIKQIEEDNDELRFIHRLLAVR